MSFEPASRADLSKEGALTGDGVANTCDGEVAYRSRQIVWRAPAELGDFVRVRNPGRNTTIEVSEKDEVMAADRPPTRFPIDAGQSVNKKFDVEFFACFSSCRRLC